MSHASKLRKWPTNGPCRRTPRGPWRRAAPGARPRCRRGQRGRARGAAGYGARTPPGTFVPAGACGPRATARRAAAGARATAAPAAAPPPRAAAAPPGPAPTTPRGSPGRPPLTWGVVAVGDLVSRGERGRTRERVGYARGILFCGPSRSRFQWNWSGDVSLWFSNGLRTQVQNCDGGFQRDG